MDNEWLVMGSWAINKNSAMIRHKLCTRDCVHYRETQNPMHQCRVGEDFDNAKTIPIPPIVITASKLIKEILRAAYPSNDVS